ncbi:MAG: aminotransferase class III-fold pyridoxal phosphate-dependent enzyme [Nannocystaceae bacterium]|nr:aminotransferase class III-fold pyridoxal phosphate-dependent enzyme [Nannocystaceae bacterium]
MRPRHVIHSQLICADYNGDYPEMVSGEGVYLIDRQGRRYLDASGCTAAVTNLGHGHPRIAAVLAEQARTLAVHPTHVFHSEVLERYLGRLCAFAPDGFNHAWTICGGTEAIENSIKLAYQYHRAKGRTTRNRVLGRRGSYHGNSILALDVGGLKARRDFYSGLLADRHLHLSPCFPWRRAAEQSESEYEDALIDEASRTLSQYTDEILAFVAEPIVGAALGAVAPTPRYFERIAALCREHDVLMIADEVMTGFGRTGRAFGCEHFGTHTDILACAKGISGGYFPMGAVIAHDRVLEPIVASGVPFQSGQTYSCIPLAAAVGEAVLDVIEDEKLVAASAQVGIYLRRGLETLLDRRGVGDVRGTGLFLSVELVQDVSSKAPFATELGVAKRVEAAALQRGLVTYACRGTVEGTRGDHLLFAPPLVLTEADADFIIETLRASIDAVMAAPELRTV